MASEQQINKIAENQLRPTIVDRVSKKFIFYGFPLPSTTSEEEASWLIQIDVTDDDGVERTGFANGVRCFNQAWSDRYSLEYKMGENFENSIEFVNPNQHIAG